MYIGLGCQSCRGHVNRENEHFPVPRSRLRIWPRETGSAVPSRVNLLILHTQAEFGAYSRDSSRFTHLPHNTSKPRGITFLRFSTYPTSAVLGSIVMITAGCRDERRQGPCKKGNGRNKNISNKRETAKKVRAGAARYTLFTILEETCQFPHAQGKYKYATQVQLSPDPY